MPSPLNMKFYQLEKSIKVESHLEKTINAELCGNSGKEHHMSTGKQTFKPRLKGIEKDGLLKFYIHGMPNWHLRFCFNLIKHILVSLGKHARPSLAAQLQQRQISNPGSDFCEKAKQMLKHDLDVKYSYLYTLFTLMHLYTVYTRYMHPKPLSTYIHICMHTYIHSSIPRVWQVWQVCHLKAGHRTWIYPYSTNDVFLLQIQGTSKIIKCTVGIYIWL